jgi:hypothetical protein
VGQDGINAVSTTWTVCVGGRDVAAEDGGLLGADLQLLPRAHHGDQVVGEDLLVLQDGLQGLRRDLMDVVRRHRPRRIGTDPLAQRARQRSRQAGGSKCWVT